MTLRIHIDGAWSASQFSDFYYALQDLSHYWIADMEYRFAPRKAGGLSVGGLRRQNSTLIVQKIHFASPGFTDLAGLGAILSELRQFLEFLIRMVVEREDRQLDRETKRLQNLETKMRILKELEELEQLSPSIAKLIEPEASEILIDAIADGRLRGVEKIEE